MVGIIFGVKNMLYWPPWSAVFFFLITRAAEGVMLFGCSKMGICNMHLCLRHPKLPKQPKPFSLLFSRCNTVQQIYTFPAFFLNFYFAHSKNCIFQLHRYLLMFFVFARTFYFLEIWKMSCNFYTFVIEYFYLLILPIIS